MLADFQIDVSRHRHGRQMKGYYPLEPFISLRSRMQTPSANERVTWIAALRKSPFEIDPLISCIFLEEYRYVDILGIGEPFLV